MKNYEVIIIGGGLAGLTAAIHLQKKGVKVCVFEKEAYPHHKVCGEYLSNEILPYFSSLGISLAEVNPVRIDKLLYSTPSGKPIKSKLPLGGMGISRFALDNFIYQKAIENGVEIIQASVEDIHFSNENFEVATSSEEFTARFVVGAYGKRTTLDKNLNRDFIKEKSEWLAVKAHYKYQPYPDNLVSLHNFKGGYCGLSKTESGSVNVCYLATYKSFKKHKNTDGFRQKVLCENPFLNEFFKTAVPEFEKELSIAQISFSKKSLIQNHILMIGDAAGLIHPLCGNGMAMAVHSAKMLAETLVQFYENPSSNRKMVEKKYQKKWQEAFSARIKAGRVLQKILLNPTLAEIGQNILSGFPSILPIIVSKTHGSPVI